MEKVTKWIILIWHQASDANAFYVLDNGETEAEQKFNSRVDARKEIEKILNENEAIFNLYGPFSDFAKNPYSDAHIIWDQKSIETIIPNNRKIVKLLESCYHLLTDDEKLVFETFKVHKDGFEFNKLSGDKNSSVILFPKELKNIFL